VTCLNYHLFCGFSVFNIICIVGSALGGVVVVWAIYNFIEMMLEEI